MLSSIKLYLFPLKLSFGMLEMLYFGGFGDAVFFCQRYALSPSTMRTIYGKEVPFH